MYDNHTHTALMFDGIDKILVKKSVRCSFPPASLPELDDLGDLDDRDDLDDFDDLDET